MIRGGAFVTIGLCCAALIAAGASARAASVSGTIADPSIVWVSDGSSVADAEAQIHNDNREFVPSLLVIRAGTSVRFPNDDPFFHSIYSSSPLDPFDIGYYGLGPGKLVRFSRSAVVEVRCHIHPKMHGTIVVVDGPNSGGLVTQFRIRDVLPGTHELHWWNARTGEKTLQVAIPAGDATQDVGALR